MAYLWLWAAVCLAQVGLFRAGSDGPADPGAVAVAMLQIAAAPSVPESLAKAEGYLQRAAAQGADLAVLPEAFLPAPCPAHTPAFAALARRLAIAAVLTCDDPDGRSAAVLVDRTGRALLRASAIKAPPPAAGAGAAAAPSYRRDPSVAVLQTARGNATVGLVVGLPDLWDPLVPRALGVAGAELILNPMRARVRDRDTAMLLTRGFENVAAVVRVNPPAGAGPGGGNGLSAIANWCNDMLGAGCPPTGTAPRWYPGRADGWSQRLLTEASAAEELVLGTVPLADLRASRRGSIWGDAFRRPFRYQPLCAAVPPPAPAAPEGDGAFSVALLQMYGAASVEANVREAEAFCRRAKARGAHVAVMPEMFSVGYDLMYPKGPSGPGNTTYLEAVYRWTSWAQPLVGGGFISHFRALARELDMAIAASFLEGDDADAHASGFAPTPPKNSVALIDRHGDVVYRYSKVHTCDWTTVESMTAPGSATPVQLLDIGTGRTVAVGSMICADREFPETARLLMLQGAEVLLVPNACGLCPSQLRQFRTRAVENAVGVAMTNYAMLGGLSVAYDHEGETLALAGAAKEARIYMAHFNLTALRRHRGSAEGGLRRAPVRSWALCEMHRHPAFVEPNVFDRVSGSVV